MERLNLLVCLSLITVASTLDPRGARPVEQGTRSEKCDTQKEWPFCTDDQWGSKCPSGCRIQGLIDKYDHSALKQIEKIRSLLDQNKAKHRSADQVSIQTYNYLKDKLTTDAGHDNTYYDLAQSLRQRITDMKIKIDRQLSLLAAMKERVKDQVVEMQRLEIDIDIKLRSCKGSCESYTQYQVDQESYVALEKQVNQLDSQSGRNVEAVGSMYVMKSRLMKDVIVDSIYKSGDSNRAGQKTEDMFPDVPTAQLVLVVEGSETSPATISKVPGTSYSPSTSSSASSSSSTSSITELGGGSDLFGGDLGHSSTSHRSTKSVTCTKSIRTTIVQSKSGPVEHTEEVMEGGPECQTMTHLTNGGMDHLFPGFTSSSSSSSSSSGIFQVGGAKGSLLDSKTGLGDTLGGIDLGLFLTDTGDDDHPVSK
ncbi:fibrinogen alpha chain-like [Sebastes umbrosus]|uniref:fibrinogen alpha chain-like n=1 Tax=Sebastes umbrosus TaxID=72105 RepID=UPI0018A00A64|nr:fibrinogen alpha chain-like [Sebastes umbrosus]